MTRDVWRIDAESATRIGHPAPFPVELPRRLIDLYTFEDDLVLDPFVGSGSTVVAAARTGRIGIGYDTDATYVELAQHRLDAEIERKSELDIATEKIERSTPELQQKFVSDLTPEDRQEHFQARAVREGKKAQDIALGRLTEAGFQAIDDKAKHHSGIIDFNFQVTSQDAARQWWVDVSGAFTTSRPGLQRADAVWKLLGKLHVLKTMQDGHDRKDSGVLVLTSNLPKVGSPGDRACTRLGPA